MSWRKAERCSPSETGARSASGQPAQNYSRMKQVNLHTVSTEKKIHWSRDVQYIKGQNWYGWINVLFYLSGIHIKSKNDSHSSHFYLAYLLLITKKWLLCFILLYMMFKIIIIVVNYLRIIPCHGKLYSRRRVNAQCKMYLFNPVQLTYEIIET